MFEELNNRRKAVEENIAKSFDIDIEKARSGVYQDNPENRRLNRVGQKYGETKNTIKPGSKIKVKLPNGDVVEAVYHSAHSWDDKHTVKHGDKFYSVSLESIEKIPDSTGRKSFYEKTSMFDKLEEIKNQISSLKKERKNCEIDMEEDLAQLSEEERSDGNNKVVKHYAKELDRIDSKISSLQEKYKKQRETLRKYGW